MESTSGLDCFRLMLMDFEDSVVKAAAAALGIEVFQNKKWKQLWNFRLRFRRAHHQHASITFDQEDMKGYRKKILKQIHGG
uniref:Uncharacterized protein n=1 Tax=Ditylenchus dipsaci TaxID=166011 RepID=A0A915DG49_9BILA